MSNVINNFNDTKFREDKIKELEERYGINALEESPIWDSTGHEFLQTVPGWINAQHLGEFIGKDRKMINKHIVNNKEFNKYLNNKEYIRKYTPDEFKDELLPLLDKNFVATDSSHEKYTGKINSQGETLITLEGAMHILLTINSNIPEVIKFREAVIQETKMSVVKEKVVEEIVSDNIELLKDKVINNKEFPEPKLLENVLKDLEIAVFDLKSLTTNINFLMEIKEVFNQLSITENDPLITLVYNSKIDNVLTKLINIRSKYYENLVADINTERSYTMTDIYKLLCPNKAKRLNNIEIKNEVSKMFKKLICKGIFKKSFYYSTTKDNEGNKTKIKKYKYVATDKFDWINYTKYGHIAGNNSDTITFSEVGKELIIYMIKNDVSSLTDEKFLDWLYLQQQK